MVTEETLKGLKVGDAVRVTTKDHPRPRGFTVVFVGEHFVGLEGPKGGGKTLVPSTCGKAVQLTDTHRRAWVTGVEVA